MAQEAKTSRQPWSRSEIEGSEPGHWVYVMALDTGHQEMPRACIQPETEAQTPLYKLQTLPSSSHFSLYLPTFSSLEAQPQNRLYLETA